MAITAIGGLVWVGLTFGVAHFHALPAQAQATDTRSLENQAVVEQLQAIHIEQAARDDAERAASAAEDAIVLNLCMAHKLTDPMQCARVGYEVEE